MTVDTKLTADQVAEKAGFSRQTVQAWYNEGLARSPTTDQLIHFLANRSQAQSTSSKRQALAAAQAEKFELENARRRGELVLAEDADAMFAQAAADLVGQLEGLPGRLANELAGISDAGIIRERLLEECRAIRLVLADSPAKAPISDSGGEDLETDHDSAPIKDTDRVGGRKLPNPEGKRGAGRVSKREDAVPRADARIARKVQKARRDHRIADGKDDRVFNRHRTKARR